MLAHDEVEVGVIGHAIAFVGRPADFDDAASGVPPSPHVGWHVREQKIVIDRMPDRPLSEGEPGSQLDHRRIEIDQVREFRP